MKLHLRTIELRAVTYRLVTLRPHTDVAFSTNYFHDTWHILSDRHGASLLARLMWRLSFQRKPGTAVLIHGEHIKSTPFGAERSDPILLTLADAPATEQRSLSCLHRRLNRLGASQCTLRWHTLGLDRALERESKQPIDWSRESHDVDWMFYNENKPFWNAERMFRRGGFVCYSAPPAIMRQRAFTVAKLDPQHHGMDYYFLADNNLGYWADGEVQIFSDYHERRSAAAEARRDVLHEGRMFADPDSLYAVVARQLQEQGGEIPLGSKSRPRRGPGREPNPCAGVLSPSVFPALNLTMINSSSIQSSSSSSSSPSDEAEPVSA